MMGDFANKCVSVSYKTIAAVLVFVIGTAFAAGIWCTGVSTDLKQIKEGQLATNSLIIDHIKKSEVVVSKYERVANMLATRCCSEDKGIRDKIYDTLNSPN